MHIWSYKGNVGGGQRDVAGEGVVQGFGAPYGAGTQSGVELAGEGQTVCPVASLSTWPQFNTDIK